MNSTRLQFAYDPICYKDFDLDLEALRQAARGEGDIGFILACGEGKDPMATHASVVDDVVKGMSDGDKADSEDTPWSNELQARLRVGLTSNRRNNGGRAAMLEEDRFAYAEIVGKTAFWPSVRGAFYEEKFLRPSGFLGDDLRGADWVPVWRDYVYRGMYAMASELVRKGARKLMITESCGGEFTPKMNYVSGEGPYKKEDGFLAIAFDALKNVAQESDVNLSVMLFPLAVRFFSEKNFPIIDYALRRQVETPQNDHVKFDVRRCNARPGVEVVDFTCAIRHPTSKGW